MKQGETFVNVNGNGGYDSNPYARMSNSFSGETYVPGMQEKAAGVEEVTNNASMDNTPVVGFLYSISRQGIGEYWPLHLGKNTIGRAATCDIQLREMSVSDLHASISIKQMKTTHKLIASIRDEGSKNGIYINKDELDYDSHSCKTNDIITIGSSYQLLLLLIDAEQYGLTIAENFVPDNSFNPQSRQGGSQSTFSDFDPYNPEGRQVDLGTVDLNGGQAGGPGGTSFM